MKENAGTKDVVLAMLKLSDGYLSGEAIGERLRVSRAAVAGAVKALREDGYEIDSATNRGYRLSNTVDALTRGEIAAYLALDAMEQGVSEKDALSQAFGRLQTVACFERVDSTNRALAQMALDGAPDGAVAIADQQTAGRGRMGRSFSSPAGVGVYFSYLFRPDASKDERTKDAAAWTSVTSKTAVAISDAIEAVCGRRPQIKWVNDLYLDGKKICGILTQMDVEPESSSARTIVAGIGVNVNERVKDFPKEIRMVAGSLYTVMRQTYARAHLAARMIEAMDALRLAKETDEARYLERYRADSLLIGKQISVLAGGKERAATAEAIGDDYALRVRFKDGTREELRGGEVSIRPQNETEK